MKFILFLTICVLALTQTQSYQVSDFEHKIAVENIPIKCKLALTRLAIDLRAVVQQFTKEFEFWSFIEDSLKTIDQFHKVEQQCDGAWLEIAKDVVLAAIPAQWRPCAIDTYNDLVDVDHLVKVIKKNPKAWYPITQACLKLSSDIATTVYDCMNANSIEQFQYPVFTQNQSFIDDCAGIISQGVEKFIQYQQDQEQVEILVELQSLFKDFQNVCLSQVEF
ncbi:hypothetical protein PPERSA_00353 [Pseudocohnilembus persalinus]|uniref:Secreted protein n=1 Tax=Pseudocohnilembus persalinus TaxID=266149 RepID=A0A0V0QXW9_PSEPJ|nr:hypothetical protein PPERSA_00353 [Pseudocohnilembus persalinus]|eukprot:KRX07196.1 hypothetical protein PPERSA_00353 [Pseudocohnilembus persalinus]